MRFESCLAVLLASLVVFAVGSNDGQNSRHILGLNRLEDKGNSIGDAVEKRSKRSLSDSERVTVLYNFNYQRSLVGASDMNFVGYDMALEAGLNDWTRGCNYDALVSVPDNVRAFKIFNHLNYPNHEEVIRYVFSLPSTSFAVRSIYVRGAAASVNFCETLIAEGRQYNKSYLSAYGITTEPGLFNETVQQYTLGPACTRCPSNVAWCYYKSLCRADCSFSISECCQISNGAPTTVCATTPTSTSATTRSNNGRSAAPGTKDIGTVILHGFLLFTCYYFL